MRAVFTAGVGVTGLAIRWYTWDQAAHFAFQLDDGAYLDATPSRGVAKHRDLDGAVVASYEIPWTSEQNAAADRWLKQQTGKPYDWSGILGLGIRREWRHPGQWFCSELGARCGEVVKFFFLNPISAADRITPRDMHLSPVWIEVRP